MFRNYGLVQLENESLTSNGTWTTRRLGDLCEKIGSGATPRGGASVYRDHGAAFIRSQNIYNDGFDTNGLVFLDDSQAEELRGVEVRPNDVLLNITGDSVARCNRAPANLIPARVSQHVAIIRPQPKYLRPRFLHYLFISPQWQELLLSLASAGGTRQALTKGMIEGLKVPVPDIAEQTAIEAVLTPLDDKIELNRRTNETLEAMARSLFKSWFDQQPENQIAIGDLEARGILAVNDGYRAKNNELGAPGLPFVRAGNLNGGGFDLAGSDLLAETRIALAGVKLSQPGDVAFTSKGTVGRFAFVHKTTPTFVYSPQLCFWRSLIRDHLEPHVLFQWMMSDELLDQIDAVKGQTDMADYVSLRDQRRMKFTAPLGASQVELGRKLEPLMNQISANLEESRTLASLRNSLLPKLLSGELRLRDTERKIKEVV